MRAPNVEMEWSVDKNVAYLILRDIARFWSLFTIKTVEWKNKNKIFF